MDITADTLRDFMPDKRRVMQVATELAEGHLQSVEENRWSPEVIRERVETYSPAGQDIKEEIIQSEIESSGENREASQQRYDNCVRALKALGSPRNF